MERCIAGRELSPGLEVEEIRFKARSVDFVVRTWLVRASRMRKPAMTGRNEIRSRC